MVRVSVSSTNTCPSPKAAAYSASATDATITGMRWQKAWRGALWVTKVGKPKDRWDWRRETARTRVCLVFWFFLLLSGGGLRR